MIEVMHLSKRYRRNVVLKDIHFTLEKGKITSLIGLNGSGKSTVLKAIMRLVPPDGGAVRIDGAEAGLDIYEKVAFIPDHLTMPSSMMLSDALQFMADFYQKTWNSHRANSFMQFFQLDGSMKIGSLSKGNAAKFNLVLGLAQDTDYLLMDEPFAGIDLFSREKIAEVFTSELIEHRGVLITTHEINEIEHLVDCAVLLKDGVIHSAFDTEQLRCDENKSIVDRMREVYRA